MTRDERVPANVWCGEIQEALLRLKTGVAEAWANPKSMSKTGLLDDALRLLDKASVDIGRAVALLAMAGVDVRRDANYLRNDAFLRWWHMKNPGGSAVLRFDGTPPLFDEVEEVE